MSLKPLIITTQSVQAAGAAYTWNNLLNAELFIRSIVTQEVNIEQSEELDKLISGIPTPFARMAMFRYAINYAGQEGEELTGLLAFYSTLQNEWKGLVACIALDNQPISVEKIPLSYSDGKQLHDTLNLYEPKGALGNMLFDERALWCDQQELSDETKRSAPYLYVIRYNGVVIGATSPESFLFTAPVYAINAEKSFYSKVTKKFTDPLKGNLSPEEVEKLYAYVRHINGSINNYAAQFTKRKPDVLRISLFLNNWLNDIKAYASAKGYRIDEQAIVPNLNKFGAPFDKLFNFQTTLYGYGGRISSDLLALQLPDGFNAIEVELAELLLDPDTCTVAEIIFDDPADAAQAGVYLLRAPSEMQGREDRYFTLPLSEKGLAIFQDELEGLLQPGGNVKSYLSARYSLEKKTLAVVLQIDVNGNITSFEKNYKEPVRIEGQKVICWPDFVSKIWNKYYLYSELPHNAPELKAFPLRAGKTDYRLIATEEEGKYRFRKIALNGKKIAADDTAEILIEYDINKLGSTDLKYEIYESEDPFKGIELQFKNRSAGYLVFKSITSGAANQTLKDYRSLKVNLNPVRVGFDFGSNNTCISYAEDQKDPQLVSFKNRRRFLLGVDIASNEKLAAAPHEVFFFQNEQTESNQVKSMVMIHDERRVKDNVSDLIIELTKEAKGGFPVFEKNIPVEHSEESTYAVLFANQKSYIKFNMKWSSVEKENAYKQGFLKSLWLKTYAELLEQDKYPDALAWAFPSAMNKQILLKYGVLWDQVGQLNPLQSSTQPGGYGAAKVAQRNDGTKSKDGWKNGGFGKNRAAAQDNGAMPLRALTEAEAVCKYALFAQMQAGQRGLIIGFDIGGSTTDILCIASKKDRDSGIPDDFKDTLIKQSSIKFAAGRLADATRKSKKFQEVLRSFCRKKGIFVHGITVPPEKLNSNTATYYYNLIIDRLSTEAELNAFYKDLVSDCPELFIINAYMTGLIMFYSGQLAKKIRITQDENRADYQKCFEDITIGCFGKGGRIFDWLRALNEQDAFQYYQACFAEGYGANAHEEIVSFDIRPSDPSFVKAEVSFGLSLHNEVHMTTDQIDELVGEDGFSYNGNEIDCLSSVEQRFMQHFGNQFSAPRELKQFSKFAAIFYSFCKDSFGFNMPSMQQDINSMRLRAYVENIPEYQLAKRGQEFDFEAPVIILEGMCFLDNVLTQKLFGQ